MTSVIIAIIGSGALSAVIAGIFTLINNRNKKKSNESKLLMGIAHSMIIENASRYLAQGYVSVAEYKELEHYLYEPYKAMGGNGTAEKLMKDVSNLPTEKGGDDGR